MTNPLSATQLEILQHTLGADEHGQIRTCRNYFIGEDATCNELVSLGLMVKFSGNAATGGEPCYKATDPGREAMRANSPAAPKLTRSQQRYRTWLTLDIGMSFGEFLKRGL